jgi:hypothetical protein
MLTDVTVLFCALTFMLFYKSQFMNVKEHLRTLFLRIMNSLLKYAMNMVS